MTLYGEGYFERGEGSNYVNYGDDPGWGPTVDVLKKHLDEGASMLEFGCAKGYFVRRAVEAGFDCYGVDVSEYAISTAPVYVRDRLTVADVRSPNDLIPRDAVVSWEVLEHIEESDIENVWKVLDSSTAPGGIQVHRIGVYYAERPEAFYSDATHVLPWSRMQWEDWFDRPEYQRAMEVEKDLDARFAGRDWNGRFFAYRKKNV